MSATLNRAAVLAQLADAQPASDGLLESFGKAIADRREHSHPAWEDLFCMNLSSYMGERAAPVLRRLLDAEARVAALEADADRLQGIADREHKAFIDTHNALNVLREDANRVMAENGVQAQQAELERVREQAAKFKQQRREWAAKTREAESRAKRYRIAWRMARTRALSVGGAADRAGARVRELLPALQEATFGLIGMQMERDAARAEALTEAAEVAARAARGCGDDERGQYAASVAASVGAELRGMAEAGKDTREGESTQPAAGMLCADCESPVNWVSCPTGGWWAHRQHPADGHDASPVPASAFEDDPIAPDFFQPGHAYTHRDGSDFRCITVAAHPNTGEQRAFGWRIRNGWIEGVTLDPDDWQQYDGCQPPADESTRTVAYRGPGTGFLYCRMCCTGGGMFADVTSEDLPDGGICDDCGRDVLIDPAKPEGGDA